MYTISALRNRLSLKAPKNWVRKNGRKRRTLSRANCERSAPGTCSGSSINLTTSGFVRPAPAQRGVAVLDHHFLALQQCRGVGRQLEARVHVGHCQIVLLHAHEDCSAVVEGTPVVAIEIEREIAMLQRFLPTFERHVAGADVRMRGGLVPGAVGLVEALEREAHAFFVASRLQCLRTLGEQRVERSEDRRRLRGVEYIIGPCRAAENQGAGKQREPRGGPLHGLYIARRPGTCQNVLQIGR